MSSTACLLSKSDVDWWGRAASRPRLQKRFPNAHPLSSPDPLKGGGENTQPLQEATKTVSERPSPLLFRSTGWGGERKDTVPAGGDENGFRTPVSSPQPRGDMEPCPQPCPSPLQFKCLKGGGSFPPPQRHWKRFPMSQPGGGAFPPSPIHGHGLLSIPPPAATLETVSDVYRGGETSPPPATFELGWGRALLGTWLHLPTGLRRGGGRLETVLMSRLWSIVIYPCAHRHWIWRRDGRSETVFVGSAKRHAR